MTKGSTPLLELITRSIASNKKIEEYVRDIKDAKELQQSLVEDLLIELEENRRLGTMLESERKKQIETSKKTQ